MPLPLHPEDPFLPKLRSLVGKNFPEVKRNEQLPSPSTTPIKFHDMHLDSHLTLKRIRIVPFLHESLVELMETSLANFVNNGHTFIDHFEGPVSVQPRQQLEDGHSVCLGYAYLFAFSLVPLATKLELTSDITEWPRLIFFEPDLPKPLPGFAHEGRVFGSMNGDALNIPPHLLGKVPKAAGDDVLDMNKIFDYLAIWSFYPLTKQGKNVVSQMPSMSKYIWKCAHTTGGAMGPKDVPIPPDAPNGFVNDQINRFLSTRRNVTNELESTMPQFKTRDIRIPAKRTARQYIPSSMDYIQKAWCNAVRDDTTYMLFNCGSHERIGIRHRASQTLYLSGLLDTVHTNPAYGKIHLGLHIALLKDALIRKDLRRKFNEKHNVNLKRSAEKLDREDDTQRAERINHTTLMSPRLLNSAETYHVSQVEKEMCKRSALLVNLDYGDYHSPSPSCFLRKGTSCVRGLFEDKFEPEPQRKVYSSADYMTATLRSPIGRGAVGTAHRCIIELFGPSEEKLTHSCLVKLAYTDESRAALQHEFDIYTHLARKEMVSGIVRIHGLFEDTETDTLALLMDYGGYSLRRRAYNKDNEFEENYVCLEKDEFNVIIQALEQIHSAGICHQDIRIDNIVVNDSKEFAIIDFDQAIYPKWPRKYAEDMKELLGIMYYRKEKPETHDGGLPTT